MIGATNKTIAVGCVVAMVLLMTALRPLPGQAQPPANPDTITFKKADQPRIQRPVLDGMKSSARRDGITLAQAIDRYASKARLSADMPDGSVTYPDVLIDDLPLVELIDLRVAAKSDGISYEQAIERYGWQPRLNAIAGRLLKSHPSELSGVAVVDKAEKVRIGFKDDIPEDAVALARTLPVEVELLGRKGFSEAELKQVMETAHDSLHARPDVHQVMGHYDVDTGRVTLSVNLRPARTKVSVADLQPTPPANPAISVNVELDAGARVVPEVAPRDRYLRGGGKLTQPGDSQPGCTSGFNVVSNTGVRSSATARHCALPTLIYSNHSSQGGSTTISRLVVAANYDLGRMSSGTMTTTRTFYSDWQSSRYADAVGGNPYIGQLICKFGIHSGTGCSHIKAINEFIDDPQGRPSRGLIVMDSAITKGGDSGGPWYYGGTAWGYHQGQYSPNRFQSKTSAFTPAYLVPSAFGAEWKVYHR
jgi:hypothetical protein